MKILHTADLHIASESPGTLEALDVLLDTAEDEEVDLLTIGGDIFDSPEDASRLRSEVSQRCSDLPFDILGIPGNHDADIFRQEFDLGSNLRILRDEPFEDVPFDDVSIIGVPFTRRLSSELFSSLREAGQDQSVRVMLLHCTLDLGFGRNAAGDEEEGRYFPVELATLGRLEYDFILGGHIHVRYQTRELSNGGQFVYPGSPISHSWTELGPRYACLIDTDTRGMEKIKLETPYRDRKELIVTPDNQEEVPAEIEGWLEGHDPDRSTLEIVVQGYVDASEPEYNTRLRELTADTESTIDVKSVSSVLEHDIYQGVMNRLDEDSLQEYDRASSDGVEQLLLNELATLIHTGEVR